MFRMLRTVANPFTRTAMLAFAWANRHTILRWGRSFWNELSRPGMIEPARLALIARVLWAITRDERLANARQLKHVRLDGDTLVVDSTAGWTGTARLVDELGGIPGIAQITDPRGNALAGSVYATATG